MRKILFLAGVFLILCVGAGIAAPVTVNVAVEGPNQFRIGLSAMVRAPREAVWKVLTDYDHHAGILPYMSKSRVIRASWHRATVEQEGRIRVFFWTFTMRVVQEVTEKPPAEMRFHAIDGDFQRLEGIWQLKPVPMGTELSSDFLVEPKRSVPEWAVRFTARHYLAAMVRSLERHAEAPTR